MLCGLFCGLALAGPAAAETAPRCAILAQVAVSAWLQMLQGLSAADPDALPGLIAQLDHAGSAHATFDCDTAALGAAMDCLIDRSGEAAAWSLAGACLAEIGLMPPGD